MKRTVGLELIWKVCMETLAKLHAFQLEIKKNCYYCNQWTCEPLSSTSVDSKNLFSEPQYLFKIAWEVSSGVLQRRCSKKFRKTHRKAPVPESLFYWGLQFYLDIGSDTGVFLWNFVNVLRTHILQNTVQMCLTILRGWSYSLYSVRMREIAFFSETKKSYFYLLSYFDYHYNFWGKSK